MTYVPRTTNCNAAGQFTGYVQKVTYGQPPSVITQKHFPTRAQAMSWARSVVRDLRADPDAEK